MPLFEVEEILDMNSWVDPEEEAKNKKSKPKPQRGSAIFQDEEAEKKPGDSNKVKFKNALQIRTVQDGYNSGRKYYIQTSGEEESQEIMRDLEKLAKIALEKFLAKSQFMKAQVIHHIADKSYTIVSFQI